MCDRGELLAVVVLCVSWLMSLIVCVCVQLGGTVGDIESMPFIEAFRQFQFKVKRENFCNIHVSLIPQVGERHLQAGSSQTYRDKRQEQDGSVRS